MNAKVFLVMNMLLDDDTKGFANQDIHFAAGSPAVAGATHYLARKWFIKSYYQQAMLSYSTWKEDT